MDLHFQTDGLAIITENDWKLFCEQWGGIEEKGISAEIDFSNFIEDGSLGSCEEMAISEELMSLHEANGEPESRKPFIKTFPEVRILICCC